MHVDVSNAWNPGIESNMPKQIRHLATLFRPENGFTSLDTAVELRSLTGMALSELVAFRPERLALHELLVRVTADFAVPDGSRIEDLGLNFRRIARNMLRRHLEPRMREITGAYEAARGSSKVLIDQVVAGLNRDWGPAEILAIDKRASVSPDRGTVSSLRALTRVLSALFSTHGQAWGNQSLIASTALHMACNEHGGECIGETIAPWLRAAASAEGYTLLPRQAHPVVINTKGASASGKSTLRPLLRDLAGQIGVQWSDFALISPDIWRKQLLDYAALGTAYKYAGAFTSDEVQIIDQKLDRYMAAKYQRGEMTHLLIDRFRFDSFAADSAEKGSNLLTRFGQSVYLFFMITPPEQLVERAWKRGLEFGRYKAVDDTLAHSVEAYSGIPDVFFTWVHRSDKRIRFEFLDNTVRLGERPRTVAFGDNDTFNVLDVKGMLDIERYARVNVDAADAAALYADRTLLAPEQNVNFLKRCLECFRIVNFAHQTSGEVYLRVQRGTFLEKDSAALRTALLDSDTRAAIEALIPGAMAGEFVEFERRYLAGGTGAAHMATLGQWGRSA